MSRIGITFLLNDRLPLVLVIFLRPVMGKGKEVAVDPSLNQALTKEIILTGSSSARVTEPAGQQPVLETSTRGRSMGLFMSMFKDILTRLDRIEEKMNGASFQLMSCEEAAQYLKVSKSHIYKLTSQDQIPYYKPNGKKIYFNKGDLDGWIKHGRVLTKDEISEVADVWLSRSGRGRRPKTESTRTLKT